jgi:fluoroquinolone transport system ATP-binding protein
MISVKELSFTYPKSNKTAVENLNFDIMQGEIFGFLGPSGAGKSTTQKILTGLLSGFKGSVDILGKSLESWKEHLYEKLGVMFEFPNHFTKLSAIENLQLFQSLYPEKHLSPAKLLDQVGLLGDANTRVANFSKGMKTRLSFIRAIQHEPSLIFLDEPTSGLDPMNARLIKQMILELRKQGKTVFLTTHNMHDAEELCDRVGLIADGKLVVVDSPQALKNKHSEHQVEITFYDKDKHLQSRSFPLATLSKESEFFHIVQSYTLQAIQSKQATLEDIFLHYTGRSLQ